MIKNIVLKWVFATIIISSFWFIAYLILDMRTMPSPIVVYGNIPKIIMGDEFYLHIFASLKRVFWGLTLSLVIGVSFGILMGTNNKIDNILNPIVYTLYPVPKLAFLPIIILIFGLRDSSKVIMIVLIIVFQIITSIRNTIKNIPVENYLYFKVLGIGKIRTFYYATHKYILKDAFTSLKIALGTAISVLFFTESYGTRYGIGFYIMDCFDKADYVDMYTNIVILSFVGYVLFSILDLLEKKITPWDF